MQVRVQAWLHLGTLLARCSAAGNIAACFSGLVPAIQRLPRWLGVGECLFLRREFPFCPLHAFVSAPFCFAGTVKMQIQMRQPIAF